MCFKKTAAFHNGAGSVKSNDKEKYDRKTSLRVYMLYQNFNDHFHTSCPAKIEGLSLGD